MGFSPKTSVVSLLGSGTVDDGPQMLETSDVFGRLDLAALVQPHLVCLFASLFRCVHMGIECGYKGMPGGSFDEWLKRAEGRLLGDLILEYVPVTEV